MAQLFSVTVSAGIEQFCADPFNCVALAWTTSARFDRCRTLVPERANIWPRVVALATPPVNDTVTGDSEALAALPKIDTLPNVFSTVHPLGVLTVPVPELRIEAARISRSPSL